jgi:polar amino acid transport system permease protein
MKTVRISASVGVVAFLLGLTFATFSEMRVFLPALLTGAVVTIQIALLSFGLFMVCAALAALGRISRFRGARVFAGLYIEIFRGTSLLVQLFWLFFVLPEFGVVLSPTLAGVLGLGLNFGAYGAEVVRGAILAVPKGQTEACTALNIPEHKRMLHIVLPQAFGIMVPGMANQTIELIKATSLVSAVTLVDITSAAVKQNLIHYRTIEIFLVTLLLYYCLCQLIRFSADLLEARVTRYRARRV